MADVAFVEAPAVPDLLAALRTSAPSEGQAQAALRTFVLAQSVGWEEARAPSGARTWWHHLGLLADAGVSVPLRPYGEKRPAADQHRHSCTPTLADVRRAVGQPFTVVDPWEPEFYPAGGTGTVGEPNYRPNSRMSVPQRRIYACWRTIS